MAHWHKHTIHTHQHNSLTSLAPYTQTWYVILSNNFFSVLHWLGKSVFFRVSCGKSFTLLCILTMPLFTQMHEASIESWYIMCAFIAYSRHITTFISFARATHFAWKRTRKKHAPPSIRFVYEMLKYIKWHSGFGNCMQMRIQQIESSASAKISRLKPHIEWCAHEMGLFTEISIGYDMNVAHNWIL